MPFFVSTLHRFLTLFQRLCVGLLLPRPGEGIVGWGGEERGGGMNRTHIVNTIPPLSMSLANLGNAPDQKVKIPSSLKMRVAHTKLFRYSFRASMDCMLCHGGNSQLDC